jgi:hypothetical protein
MTDDVHVRAAFDALKADDARVGPSFRAVVERPTPKRARSRTSLAFRLVAAGIVIAATAATYAKVSATHQRFTVPSEVVALGAWRPATDVLLPRTASAFGAGPVLGRSILNFDTLTGAIR